MTSKRAYLDHLASVPMLADCSKRELGFIAGVVDEIDVEAGRVLIEEGAIGKEAFVIVDGRADVRRNGKKVARLGPGDHFGELALLASSERNATVEAATEMRLLVLGQREFAGVMSEVPTLSRKILSALSGRVRDLDQEAVG